MNYRNKQKFQKEEEKRNQKDYKQDNNMQQKCKENLKTTSYFYKRGRVPMHRYTSPFESCATC